MAGVDKKSWFIPFLWMLFYPFSILAQGWEVNLGGDGPVDCSTNYCLIEDANGNYLSVGNSDFTHPDSIYAVKISKAGDVIWTKNYGSGICYDLIETPDGNYTGVGTSGGSNSSFIAKMKPNGDVEFSNIVAFNSSLEAYNVGLLSDGGYILIGLSRIDSAAAMAKTDSLGNMLWQKKFNPVGSRMERILIDQDTLYIIGKRNDSLTLTKSDQFGTILWNRSYFKDNYTNSDIKHSGDGNFYISGSNSGYGTYGNATIIKVDRNGNNLWQTEYGNTPGIYFEAGSFDLTSDNGFIIAGNKSQNCCQKIRFLLKLDSLGNTEWIRDYYDQIYVHNLSHDVLQSVDGGYVMAGQAFAGKNQTYKYNVTKTNSQGFHQTNFISGYIYLDDNQNCVKDGIETGIANASVRVEPGPLYAMTDANGYFMLNVDSGAYTVYSAYQHPYLDQTCLLNGNAIQLNSSYQIDTTSHFGYTPTHTCPLMTVSMGTGVLRRCFQSTYQVNYQNVGTDSAVNAYVALTFDSAITPVNSSIPWTVVGNSYQFQVGNVSSWASGTFTVDVDVSCTVPLSSTACVQAHIFPDSNCAVVDTGWDKSRIEVEGICDGDSLINFIIRNTALPGIGDMDTIREYRIYEDNVLDVKNPYQLNGGDSLVIQVQASGLSYIIRANQHQDNPISSFAQTFVENCGNTSYSVSVVAEFPFNDEYGAIEVDCREIVGSWDPNEKSAQPAGFTSAHFISDDQSLEYHISFQNVGTDTAFTVVVTDTLSPHLDPASIITTASSHPFTFELLGVGIAKWTFDQIMLPDSNSSLTGSQGYIQFKVNQQDLNPSETVILNSAGIYFDYNAPVITNTTYHTVFDNNCGEYIDLGISSSFDTVFVNLPEDSSSILTYGPYDSACTYIMTPFAPKNGSVGVYGSSFLNYVPFPNYYGMDTLEFIVCSSEWSDLCDTILVIYQIAAVNDNPITVKDFIKLFTNHQIEYDICANDYDIDNVDLKMSITGLPENGRVRQLDGGMIHYQPFHNFSGNDQFIYTLCDDGFPQLCHSSTVEIEVEDNRIPEDQIFERFTGVSIYPNPVKDKTTILVGYNDDIDLLKFELIDEFGRVVRNKIVVNGNNFVMERGSLSKGVYMYRVTIDPDNIYMGKMVLE